MRTKNWSILLLTLLVAALVCYCIGLVLISSRPAEIWVAMTWISLLLLVIAGGIALGRLLDNRRAGGRVLDQLEQAVLLNLPLPRAMAALMDDLGKDATRRLRLIPSALQRGEPIAAVLSEHVSLPRRTLKLIAFAEASGQLDRVIPALAEQRRATTALRVRGGSFYRVYPLLVLTVALGIITVLRVFVGPKFQQIFRDFHTPMPWIAQTTMTAGGETAMSIFMLLFFLLAAMWAWRTLLGNPAQALQETGFAWIGEALPLLGRPRRDAAWAEAFEFMADSLADDRALGATLETAAMLTQSRAVRARLSRFSSELTLGRPLPEAARAAELPGVFVGLLGRDASDLIETMKFAALQYRSRSTRTAAWFDLAVAPGVALSMGLLVAWIMLSVFLPMVRLIDVTGAKALVVR